MNILVTGAGGFLGKHIIERLPKHHHIYATSLNEGNVKQYDLTFIPNDRILTYDFSTFDLIINCAFPRAADGVGYANGIDFLNSLFQRVEENETCGFIDISSQSLYSFTRTEPATEETQLDLGAVYDVGKYCMELLVDASLKKHKRVHLRLASLIGAGFDQRIVNRFVKSVVAGENIVVNGGQQLFGFLDVRDCADAITTVVEHWNDVDTTGAVFNIGNTGAYTLQTIAETVAAVGTEFDYNAKVIVTEGSDEWKNTSLDATKFYRTFNWQPKYSLEDTTRAIYLQMTGK